PGRRPGDLVAATYPERMEIPEIDVEELARRRQQGAPLLDVRQPEEFEEARVPGAVLVPLDQLPDRLDEVPDGDLLVICKMGGRSAKAVEFLASQGRDATNVAGGTMAWIDAGHPVDRGAGSA
ncbi:MAG: rhodanese-like domain-containing protein, partial [Actinomycetota bacterium]